MSRKVLYPPARRTPTPLPGWIGIAAVLGAFALGTSAIPAVVGHQRLRETREGLYRENRQQEQVVRRLERELWAARRDSFTREHALRRLLHPPVAARPHAPPENRR